MREEKTSIRIVARGRDQLNCLEVGARKLHHRFSKGTPQDPTPEAESYVSMLTPGWLRRWLTPQDPIVADFRKHFKEREEAWEEEWEARARHATGWAKDVDERAARRSAEAEILVTISPEFNKVALEGLSIVAGMGRVAAYLSVVKPSVAQEMLRSLSDQGQLIDTA